MARRGRRCHYINCKHQQGVERKGDEDTNEKCTFRVIPKDPIIANLWLSRGSISHLTPKRVTAFNCFICSCHFQEGNDLPDEYIEEYTDDGLCGHEQDEASMNIVMKRPYERQKSAIKESPMAKTCRVDNAITPRTKLALGALLSLQGNAEQSRPAEAEVTATPKSLVTYSPRNRLWIERGSSVRKKARRTLQNMMVTMESSNSQIEWKDSQLSQQSIRYEDCCDDLGVLPLNNCCSTPISKRNAACDTHIEIPSPAKSAEVANLTVEHNLKHKVASGTNIEMPSVFRSRTPSLEKSTEVANRTVEHNLIDDPPSPSFSKETQTERIKYRNQEVQCERSFLCYERARQGISWDQFLFYTGITKTMFEVLYTFLGGDAVCGYLKYTYSVETPKREQFIGDLYPKDKLFMTLLRLRRGIPLKDLGILFGVHHSWAGKVVFTWVRFMSLQFKLLESCMFPTGEDQNILKPKCFGNFKNLRGVIDSSEFKIQKPKHFQQQSNTFSSYKKANTLKFLICISCHGGLSHISEAYEGSISDRQLLIQSGLLDKMLPGEAIMADRGFDAEDLFDEKDLKLIMPAFLGDRQSFTARELIRNRAIAVSRIHVETFIGRIKQFRLVRHIIPNKMLPIASDLVKVCAFLSNFQVPFIVNDTDVNK